MPEADYPLSAAASADVPQVTGLDRFIAYCHFFHLEQVPSKWKWRAMQRCTLRSVPFGMYEY